MKLSILVVSHNTRDLLSKCLKSIERCESRYDHEVWVIDNDSRDGSPDMVREDFPNVHLIENETNRGFGAANNQALILAAGELVLFLNSDASLREGSLDALIDELSVDESLGALGPRLIDAHGRVERSFGKRPSILRDAWRKVTTRLYEKHNRLVSSYVERGHQHATDTDWVSGACLLTRTALLEQIGGYDERFFLYMEDVDLCVRIGDAGYRVRFVPKVRINHLRGQSSNADKKTRERTLLESIRSRILFYDKHQTRLQQTLLRAYLRLKRHQFTEPDARHRLEEILAGGTIDS